MQSQMHMELIKNQHVIQAQLASFYTKEQEAIDLQANEITNQI